MTAQVLTGAFGKCVGLVRRFSAAMRKLGVNTVALIVSSIFRPSEETAGTRLPFN